MCKNMPPIELAIQFHGHICPGLLMGVRAAEFAQKYLGVGQDYDEELLAVVETDACAVDAIQAILSCTFGKGNLIFKDYGKHVYTIASREQNKAVRIAQKYGALNGSEFERYRQLAAKDHLTDDEISEKEQLIGVLFEKIMTASFEELFDWREIPFEMPERARIHGSIRCDGCGEGVMEARAVHTDKGIFCSPCATE
ncbi:MAG: FmdE family protein [Syntrophomonadaceae bacterium]|nr:FmdE family protein [Syntrophomonadaceae bacterium]